MSVQFNLIFFLITSIENQEDKIQPYYLISNNKVKG